VGRIADAARDVALRAWVQATRLRLARLGCRFCVDADPGVRLASPPRIAIVRLGARGGTLTLRLGRDCRLGRDVTIDVCTDLDGTVEVGERTILQDRIRLQPWGGAIRIGAGSEVRDGTELKARGELVTGGGVEIARNVTVHCHERIELGDAAALAGGVSIMDSDHAHDGSATDVRRQPVVAAPVSIGANVLVGTNAVIMRGAHIGPGTVVATGAVVTAGEHPGGHLLAGAPARPVRRLAPEEPSG
jgi:acetyltransferase-like isoleucine patch superfamily enzyme